MTVDYIAPLVLILILCSALFFLYRIIRRILQNPVPCVAGLGFFLVWLAMGIASGTELATWSLATLPGHSHYLLPSSPVGSVRSSTSRATATQHESPPQRLPERAPYAILGSPGRFAALVAALGSTHPQGFLCRLDCSTVVLFWQSSASYYAPNRKLAPQPCWHHGQEMLMKS